MLKYAKFGFPSYENVNKTLKPNYALMNIDDSIRQHQEQTRKLVLSHLSPVIIQPLDGLTQWLGGYIERSAQLIKKIDDLSDQEDSIRVLLEHIQFRKEMLEYINLLAGGMKEVNTPEYILSYDTALEELVKSLPKHLKTHQSNNRFASLTTDTIWVKLIKTIKRIGFSIYSLPTKIGNIIRKVFRKNLKKVEPWIQLVPLRNLTQWSYGNEMLAKFSMVIQQSYKATAVLAANIWEQDSKLFEAITRFALNKATKVEMNEGWEVKVLPSLNSCKTQIANAKVEINEALDSAIDEIDKQFLKQISIAGTLEFKKSHYLERKRKKAKRKLRAAYATNLNHRLNTLHALSDDWKFDQEIYILTCNVQKTGLQLKFKLLGSGVNVKTSLNQISLFLEKIKSGIILSNLEEYRKLLTLLKYNAEKTLTGKLIDDVSNCILEQDFPLAIDEAEKRLLSELGEMKQKRVLIPNFDPTQPYSSRALISITPKELIDFEMAEELKRSTLVIKQDSIVEVNSIQHQLDDIGRMVMFNFETAIALIDEQGESALENSFNDTIAGIERALQNCSDLNSSFDKFVTQQIDESLKAVDHFSTSLLELTDNTRVEKIRFRIAKAKALKRGKQIIVKAKEFIELGVTKVIDYYQLSRKKVDSRIHVIRGILGIQGLAKDISSEISEYLASSESAYQALPFVYRRLFANEPLKGSTFYLSRIAETEKLLNVYQKWQQGSFMPVLIYGEKGSGISTLIEMFAAEYFKNKPQVIAIKIVGKITAENQILSLFGQSFRNKDFTCLQELYDYASQQESFVVYLDKLHLLFLRQSGGFKALKLLFEIISNTNKKIFWICTSGLYSALYLDKTLGLFGYFPEVIKMENLSITEVENIIMLRHQTSGYYLHFLPSKDDTEDRAYKKCNTKEQQAFLKTKFFDQLNKQTKSNVAFALQLWLRSINRIDTNTCYINSLDGIDFSFIYSLPAEVVFTLHNLIMHEYLDSEQLASVQNISQHKVELLLMRLTNRAITIEEQGLFSIHPLLYRQTIQLLKDKNLIH